jgi:hypothetical protein
LSVITDPQLARLREAAATARFAGRFEILAEAGAGGMGTVYRARDTTNDTIVALKVMHASGRADVARFEREAEVLAKLSHPRIVRYVAHGSTEDDEPYLAMAWLEGETLSRKLEDGARLPWRDAITLAIGVLDGIDAAHAVGAIHRDLKPANLFLVGGRVEDVRILDFGIARTETQRGETLTSTGTLVGTAGYIAPEQARASHDVDARTDLFSLGCVLYRALTGTAAFGGEHVLDALSKLLTHEPLPVHTLTPSVPPRLDALVRRLMAKDPAARPASATEVVRALHDILDDPEAAPSEDERPTEAAIGARVSHPITTHGARPRAARGAPVIALAAVAALVALVAAGLARTPVAPITPESATGVASRACAAWADQLADEQRSDGAFGVERQRDPHGWPTAQATYALARAAAVCDHDGHLRGALDRAEVALDRFRTDEGWRGSTTESEVEVGASAWGVLATLALAETRDTSRLRAHASSGAAPLLGSLAPDGGLCAERGCTSTGGASAYVTVLGAWALTELARTDTRPEVAAARDDALGWLERAILDPRSDVIAADGLAEQATMVLAWARPLDPHVVSVVSELLVARCDLDEATSRCRRSPGRVGETYVDHLPGRGPNLVTFWFPWSTLAASTLADGDPALARIATAQLARAEGGLDLLEAAPTYELAEFLLMAAALSDGSAQRDLR